MQDKINQIYTPVPDMPEREISKGLLCIAKYKDNWIRALVSAKPYNENHYFSVRLKLNERRSNSILILSRYNLTTPLH